MAKVKTQIGDCSIEECAEPKYAHNLCKKHNQRRYKTGRTDLGPRVPWNKGDIEVCIWDDCNSKHIAKGFCSKHYRAFKAWLDKDRAFEDRAKISKQKDSGYVLLYLPEHPDCSVSGLIMEHRVIMEQMIGRRLVLNENVHHKNGIRNDNRPENLELWSSRQPKGQRVEDKVEYAMEILNQYAPHLLAGDK
jgi:hypothetical protein